MFVVLRVVKGLPSTDPSVDNLDWGCVAVYQQSFKNLRIGFLLSNVRPGREGITEHENAKDSIWFRYQD